MLQVRTQERVEFQYSIYYPVGLNIVHGKPTLQPAIVHSCPNETVIFTCSGRQVMDMDWIVEPYIPIGDPIKYSSELIVNHEEEFDVFRRTDFISSELTNFTGYNNGTANMILTLTIKPFNVINGTNITCEIDESLLLLSPLHLAGIHIYIWNKYYMQSRRFVLICYSLPSRYRWNVCSFMIRSFCFYFKVCLTAQKRQKHRRYISQLY